MGELGAQHNGKTHVKHWRKRVKEKGVMDNLLGSPTLTERIALLQRSARNHKGAVNMGGTPLILPELSSSSTSSHDEDEEGCRGRPRDLAKRRIASTTPMDSELPGVGWPESDSWARWSSLEARERADPDFCHEVMSHESEKESGNQPKKSSSTDASNDEVENDFSAASVNRRLDEILNKLSRLSLPENATDEERQDVDLIRNMASLSFERVTTAGRTGGHADVDDQSIERVVHEVVSREPDVKQRRKISALSSWPGPVIEGDSHVFDFLGPRDSDDWGGVKTLERPALIENAASDKSEARKVDTADGFIPKIETIGQAERNEPAGGESVLQLNQVGFHDVVAASHVPRKRLDPSYPYYGLEGTGRLGIAERVDVFQSQRANQQRFRLEDSLSLSSVVDTDEGVGGTPRAANGAAAGRSAASRPYFWKQKNDLGNGSLSEPHDSRSPCHAHPAINARDVPRSTLDDAHAFRELLPTALLVEGKQVVQSNERETHSISRPLQQIALDMSIDPLEQRRTMSAIELDACASSLTGVSQEFLFGWDEAPAAQRRFSLQSTASLVEETFQRPEFEAEGAVESQALKSGRRAQLRDSSASADSIFVQPTSWQSSTPFNNQSVLASSLEEDRRSMPSKAGFLLTDHDIFGDRDDIRQLNVPTTPLSSVDRIGTETASHRHHTSALLPPSIASRINDEQNFPTQLDQRKKPNPMNREYDHRLVSSPSPGADGDRAISQQALSSTMDHVPQLPVPLAYPSSSDIGCSSSAQFIYPDEEATRVRQHNYHTLPKRSTAQPTPVVDVQGVVNPRIEVNAHFLRAAGFGDKSPLKSGPWKGRATVSGLINESDARSTLRPPSLVDGYANTYTPSSKAWGINGYDHLSEAPQPPSAGLEQCLDWEPFGKGRIKNPTHHFPRVQVQSLSGPPSEQVDFRASLATTSSQRGMCSSRGNDVGVVRDDTFPAQDIDPTPLQLLDNLNSEIFELYPNRMPLAFGQHGRQYPSSGTPNQSVRFSNMTGISAIADGFDSRACYVQPGERRQSLQPSTFAGDDTPFRSKTAEVERLLDSMDARDESGSRLIVESLVGSEVQSRLSTPLAFEDFLVTGDTDPTTDTSRSDRSDRSSIVSQTYQLSNVWMNRITPKAQALDPPFDLQPASAITIRQQVVKSRTLRDPPNESSRSSLGRKPKKEPEGRGLERPSSRLMNSMVCTSCSSSTGVVGQEEDFTHHNDSRDDDSDLFENIDDETACNTGQLVDEILGPPLDVTPTAFAKKTVTRRFRASPPPPQMSQSATLPMFTKPRSTLGAEVETVTSSVFAVHEGKRSAQQGKLVSKAERVPDIIKADSLEDTKATFTSSVYAMREAEKQSMQVPSSEHEERREKEKSDQVQSYWRSMSEMKPLGSFDSVASIKERNTLNSNEALSVESSNRKPAPFKPSKKLLGEPKQGPPGEVVNIVLPPPPPPPPPPMDRKQHLRVKDRLLHMGPLLSPSSDTLDSLTADSDRESTAPGDSRAKGCNLFSCGDGEWLNGWQLLGFR